MLVISAISKPNWLVIRLKSVLSVTTARSPLNFQSDVLKEITMDSSEPLTSASANLVLLDTTVFLTIVSCAFAPRVTCVLRNLLSLFLASRVLTTLIKVSGKAKTAYPALRELTVTNVVLKTTSASSAQLVTTAIERR